MMSTTFLDSLLGQQLVEKQEAAHVMQKFGGDEFAIASHLYSTEQIAREKILIGKAYGKYIGKTHINLKQVIVDKNVLRFVSREYALAHHCVPIKEVDDVITFVMAKPFDQAVIDELQASTEHTVQTEFAFPDEIDDFIDINYNTRLDLRTLSEDLSKEAQAALDSDTDELEFMAGKKGIVDLVDGLLKFCLKYDASDLHIQPGARGLNIRYRIDGFLQTRLVVSKALTGPILSRLKIMADLDVTEKRIPQDGRVTLHLPSASRDFRLSTMPTIMGEKAVIRAIGQAADQSFPPMEKIGFSPRNLAHIESIIKSTNGVLFVTGPTGSGKTTTLYSILSRLNKPNINIVTVEDPVEYRMEGITQIQANESIDLDFARILRSVLRQDPQIILIGEIRDLETARIASQAALTGHLVMASMHTNNAIQAVTRLVDIGVEPFLVAPSVIGVVGQRLVRRICEACKEVYQPSDEELQEIPSELLALEQKFYSSPGCKKCRGTGYLGRMPIHEVFIINDHIRQLISDNASIVEIKAECEKFGFKPMRYDGMLKVLQGITTFSEVNRVTEEVSADFD